MRLIVKELMYSTQPSVSKRVDLVTSGPYTWTNREEQGRSVGKGSYAFGSCQQRDHPWGKWDAQFGMDTEHHHEREFGLYWSEVIEHPSLASAKLDHCQWHVQCPQHPRNPFPCQYLSLTI